MSCHTSNKCIASSNKCLTSSNKKLVETLACKKPLLNPPWHDDLDGSELELAAMNRCTAVLTGWPNGAE